MLPIIQRQIFHCNAWDKLLTSCLFHELMWQLSLKTNCKPDLITMHQWLTVCICEQCSQALWARGEFRRGVRKIDACSFGIQPPRLSYVWASTYIFSTLLSTPDFFPKQQSLVALIFPSTFLFRLFTFSLFHSVSLKLSVLHLSIPLWSSFGTNQQENVID